MVGLCTSSDLPKCYEPRAVSMTPVSKYSASKNYIEPGAISRYFFLNVHALEMWRNMAIFKQNRERQKKHALEYMHWKCGVSVWLFGSHRLLLLKNIHFMPTFQMLGKGSQVPLSYMMHLCAVLEGLIPWFLSENTSQTGVPWVPGSLKNSVDFWRLGIIFWRNMPSEESHHRYRSAVDRWRASPHPPALFSQASNRYRNQSDLFSCDNFFGSACFLSFLTS